MVVLQDALRKRRRTFLVPTRFGIDLGQVPPDVVDDNVEVPESLVDLLEPQNDLGELAPIRGVGERSRGAQEQDSQNESGNPAPSHGVPPARRLASHRPQTLRPQVLLQEGQCRGSCLRIENAGPRLLRIEERK
jgi:hypothetical protein